MPRALAAPAVVAAMTVGFSVGDVSTALAKKAATTSSSRDSTGQESLQWSWTLAAGKTIEIKGVNGAISAQRASGNKVEVRAFKHAHHSDPDEVKVEFVEHAGGITVCAVYPGNGNTCAPGEGGHMSTHNNDVVVDFEVKVPAGVGFTGRTVNGSVVAESLDGPVEAHTVNGRVDVSTTRIAEATTVNGSITARLGSMTGREKVEFHTVNGSITLELPAGTNADLSARTVNGSIDTDLPIVVQGSMSRHQIQGQIGKGGTDLSIETVNGSIRLRKTSI
jgi:DUF4097 and DUF4098 domain-containing protein YvlB